MLFHEGRDDFRRFLDRAAIELVIAVHEKNEAVFRKLLFAKGLEAAPGQAPIFDVGRGPNVAREKQNIAALQSGRFGKFQMKIRSDRKSWHSLTF